MSETGHYFTKHGSDKNTHHTYGPLYDRLFSDRKAVKSVLEIGIASGQSLLAWLDIFPNAQVVGIDKEPCHRPEVGSTDASIHPLCPRPDRLEIQQADVRDVPGLLSAVGNRQFDLIVEDSSHVLDDNLRVLWLLYPHVAPGGIYVIEEMYGVHSYRDSFALWNGCEVMETPEPHAGELLVVIRKSK